MKNQTFDWQVSSAPKIFGVQIFPSKTRAHACLVVFDARQFGAKADAGGGDRFRLRWCVGEWVRRSRQEENEC